MGQTVRKVMQNSLPTSHVTYKIMGSRSDGRLPDRSKPATKRDDRIHMTHIVDSSQYNLRHEFDHADEMAFDFKRFTKEDNRLAKNYQKQIKSVLNPVYRKMGLEIR